jgi:hypothetical protein
MADTAGRERRIVGQDSAAVTGDHDVEVRTP